MSLIIKKGEKFEFVESWDYSKDKQENDLHKLIEKKPQMFIRTKGENKYLLTLGSKMTLTSGELDLLLVDNEGYLTLAELKRGRASRKVVAQILDYASSLHEMNLDELENSMKGQFKKLKEVSKFITF